MSSYIFDIDDQKLDPRCDNPDCGMPLQVLEVRKKSWKWVAAGFGAIVLVTLIVLGLTAGRPSSTLIITSESIWSLNSGEASTFELMSEPAGATWSVTGLPAGVSFDADKGILKGDLSNATNTIVDVEAKKGDASARQSLLIRVNSTGAKTSGPERWKFIPEQTINTRAGLATSSEVRVEGRVPLTVVFSAKGLPPGVQLSRGRSIEISSTVKPGNYDITIEATDDKVAVGSTVVRLAVAAAPREAEVSKPIADAKPEQKPVLPEHKPTVQELSVLKDQTVLAVEMTRVNQRIEYKGSLKNFSVNPGLPGGLSIDRDTGIISGMAGAIGTHLAIMTAQPVDGGPAVSANLTLVVQESSQGKLKREAATICIHLQPHVEETIADYRSIERAKDELRRAEELLKQHPGELQRDNVERFRKRFSDSESKLTASISRLQTFLRSANSKFKDEAADILKAEARVLWGKLEPNQINERLAVELIQRTVGVSERDLDQVLEPETIKRLINGVLAGFK